MVHATIDPVEAGRKPWPVIVVGAGPAGSLAARELARRGIRVILVDRAFFPRHKVCGCCLNGRALAALDRIGLATLTCQANAVPLQNAVLSSPGSRAKFALPSGMALSRMRLDTALIEAATAAGAEFLPGFTAHLVPSNGPLRRISLANGGRKFEVQAKVVLAADGLAGGLLSALPSHVSITLPHSRIGLATMVEHVPSDYCLGTIYMACGRGGYVGVVRVESGLWNVAAAADPQCLRLHGSPARFTNHMLRSVGFPPLPMLARARWRGTCSLTRRSRRVCHPRILLVGDAVGYTEPFTGQGIGWAMENALDVVPLAIAATRNWAPALGVEWSQICRRAQRAQIACRLLAGGLRLPAFPYLLTSLLRRLPSVAEPFLHALNWTKDSEKRQ